jgi:ATP-binding cassette subfamily C exporter for protease/lipase
MMNRFFQRSELTAALWSFRRELAVVIVFSFVANLLMLVPTLYMLQVFDRVLVSQSELTLLAVSLITLFLLGVLAFSEWSRSRVLVHAGVRFDHMLSTRVFNASFDAYLTQSTAGPARAFNDLLQLRQFLTGNGIFGFLDAPWAPIYLVVVWFLHPMLGVATLVFACVQGALAWLGHRKTVAPAEAASQAASDVNVFVQSKLRNAEVIESMGMVDHLRARWRHWQGIALARGTEAFATTNRAQGWSKFVRYTQQSFTLGIGALLVIQGELSAGAMIAANVLMARALAPIDQLVSLWRSLAVTRGAFERLEKLLAEFPERDPNLSRAKPRGEVQLRDVVATAPGRREPILKGVSFHAQPGTVTAIVGPSGSGKSTLSRVLVGIWPEVGGEVLLDEMPLSSWDRGELGTHIGYLPQDVELLEGTIAENIARFGKLDSEKVIEAAKLSGLHDMILRFPKGYDTPVGEAGRLLSGGQRQRIGLARAVYGEPPLVVLDEPNANLDDVGDAALVRALQQLKTKGATVLIVTHRPTALNVADRMLWLRAGEVAAFGTPAEVIAQMRPHTQPPAAPQGAVVPA